MFTSSFEIWGRDRDRDQDLFLSFFLEDGVYHGILILVRIVILMEGWSENVSDLDGGSHQKGGNFDHHDM